MCVLFFSRVVGNYVTAGWWTTSIGVSAFIFICWWHCRPFYDANDLAFPYL